MILTRLTGAQALAVLPPLTGLETQAGSYKADAIDADFTANGSASMTGRAYTWTFDELVRVGVNTNSLTSDQKVHTDRIQGFRVVLDCLQNSRLINQFESNSCEPTEIYDRKVRAIQNELCIAVSALGLTDDINCFKLSNFVTSSQIECNCNG